MHLPSGAGLCSEKLVNLKLKLKLNGLNAPGRYFGKFQNVNELIQKLTLAGFADFSK